MLKVHQHSTISYITAIIHFPVQQPETSMPLLTKERRRKTRSKPRPMITPASVVTNMRTVAEMRDCMRTHRSKSKRNRWGRKPLNTLLPYRETQSSACWLFAIAWDNYVIYCGRVSRWCKEIDECLREGATVFLSVVGSQSLQNLSNQHIFDNVLLPLVTVISGMSCPVTIYLIGLFHVTCVKHCRTRLTPAWITSQ